MDTQTGRTRAAKQLKDATAFFYEHAGFSYDPATETQEQGKRRCALVMARAERDAKRKGITFTWEYDQDADASFVETWEQSEQDEWNSEEHEAWVCLALMPCGECEHPEVKASLCGIFNPTAAYRRVIEAELAMEALAR